MKRYLLRDCSCATTRGICIQAAISILGEPSRRYITHRNRMRMVNQQLYRRPMLAFVLFCAGAGALLALARHVLALLLQLFVELDEM